MTLRHRAIIKRLGGYVFLAQLFGVEPETTKSWLKAGRGIPARYWHKIEALDPRLTPAYLERTAPKKCRPRR